MLVYSRDINHVHEFYVILELLDRTWSESRLFRNEHFETKEDAYEALLDRADPTALYVVQPVTSFYLAGRQKALDESK